MLQEMTMSKGSHLKMPSDHIKIIRELQDENSHKALEIELLTAQVNKLEEERNLLLEVIREKDEYQTKLTDQLQTVIDIASSLYDKVCAFKTRFYHNMK